jgi:GNAT superfamily N-acetyltransferase
MNQGLKWRIKLANQQSAPEFEQMHGYYDRDVNDFVPLLSHLSKSFAAKDAQSQLSDIELSLDRIMHSADTAVFIHAPEDSEAGEARGELDGHILSTATANKLWTPEREGWVDDVVTLPEAGGRGLGSAGMKALHDWFSSKGVTTVRLTSAHDRGVAGDMYAKMGYVEGGQVWRASLDGTNTANDHDRLSAVPNYSLDRIYDLSVPKEDQTPTVKGALSNNLYFATRSSTSTVIIGRDDDAEIDRTAMATNCYIPTGNKAWLYGVHADTIEGMVKVIREAHSALAIDRITSSNVMTFGKPGEEELVEALQETGYKPRETRLYTLDLSSL